MDATTQDKINILVKELGFKPETVAMFDNGELCIIISEPQPNPDPQLSVLSVSVQTMRGQELVSVNRVETVRSLAGGGSRWKMENFLNLVKEIPAEVFRPQITQTPTELSEDRRSKLFEQSIQLIRHLRGEEDPIKILEIIKEINAIVDGRRD